LYGSVGFRDRREDKRDEAYDEEGQAAHRGRRASGWIRAGGAGAGGHPEEKGSDERSTV
jgi:hypothetical protein